MPPPLTSCCGTAALSQLVLGVRSNCCGHGGFWGKFLKADAESAEVRHPVCPSLHMNKPLPPSPSARVSKHKYPVDRTDDPPKATSVSVNLPGGRAVSRIAQGDSIPRAAQSDKGEGNLRLPHDRDESTSGSTATAPDPLLIQAARDLQAGQVDTDMRATPGLDAVRRRVLTKRRP